MSTRFKGYYLYRNVYESCLGSGITLHDCQKYDSSSVQPVATPVCCVTKGQGKQFLMPRTKNGLLKYVNGVVSDQHAHPHSLI